MTSRNLTPLPLPDSHAAPDDRQARGDTWSFAEQVDSYCRDHGVARAECFRRLEAATGNSRNGLILRYQQRGDAPWRFAS